MVLVEEGEVVVDGEEIQQRALHADLAEATTRVRGGGGGGGRKGGAREGFSAMIWRFREEFRVILQQWMYQYSNTI